MRISHDKPEREGCRFKVSLHRSSEQRVAYVYADRVELEGPASPQFRSVFACWKGVDEWVLIDKLQTALRRSPVGAASIWFE